MATPKYPADVDPVDGTAWNAVATQVDTNETDIATLGSAVALNTAKTSNATHTGEVTGATTLTIAEGATVTPATGDVVLGRDASDGDALVTFSVDDLGGGGGGVELLPTVLTTPSGAHRHLVQGPFRTVANATAQAAGTYSLGLCHVGGGTVVDVLFEVATAGTTSNLYYVIYNRKSDIMPGTLAHSFGPFSAATTGSRTITGLSTVITPGLYWVGTFAPTANGGTCGGKGGGEPSLHAIGTPSLANRNTLISGDSGHSTPQDLSSFTPNTVSSATTLGYTNGSIANLYVTSGS